MKKYFAPMTKVVSINMNSSIMEPSINNTSSQTATDEPCGDAPLF